MHARARPGLLLWLALASLHVLGHAQDATGEPDDRTPLERARERGRGEAEPLLGPDGRVLVPGELPAGTSESARSLWRSVVATALAPEPVRAFDLSFFLLQRSEGPQTNNVKARIQFLAPGFVRAMLQKSGREHLRGPEGDWLIDGEERVRLVGREGAEDVRQIDDVVGIARNFVALTNPAALRIARLEIVSAPPAELPARFGELAPRLSWIAVQSPDFRLPGSSAAGAPVSSASLEALLGVDPASHRIQLALIRELGAQRPGEEERILLQLLDPQLHGGFLVPRRILLFQLAREARPPRLREEPSSELTLMRNGIDLRADLVPEDFLPGARRASR